MTFAHADSVSIRVHHLGGSGPPLLCVHATGFHGRVWEPFVPRLRQDFSILALDQRGHGESDKPETGYEWTNFGKDVIAVVDHCELEQPVGIGHSAGAAALVFAEASRPGTFSRLVLLDPVTPPPDIQRFISGTENPMSAATRRRRRIWDSTDEMLERLRNGTTLSGWQDDFLRAYVTYGTSPREDGTVELKCPPEIEAQIYEMGRRHDGWHRLDDISCPTLLLTGTESHMWLEERNQVAASKLRAGRAETVPGGHFFPMENPEATLDRVVPFLLDG